MSPVTRECCPSGYVTTCRTTYGGQTVWQVVTGLLKRRRRRLLAQRTKRTYLAHQPSSAFLDAQVGKFGGQSWTITLISIQYQSSLPR